MTYSVDSTQNGVREQEKKDRIIMRFSIQQYERVKNTLSLRLDIRKKWPRRRRPFCLSPKDCKAENDGYKSFQNGEKRPALFEICQNGSR